MIATGIVRKIDDLGRIVIPKEVRLKLNLKEGSPLEIYTDNDGHLILVPFESNATLTNNFFDAFKSFDNDEQKTILKNLIELMKI